MKISCRKSNIAKLRFASIDPRWQILQEHRGFLSFTIALTEFCISFHSHLGWFVCLFVDVNVLICRLIQDAVHKLGAGSFGVD